jgi:phosphohistidine phosphatase
MKTLLILRHAKSSWKDAGLPDHDRPLNKRGKADAPKMGRLLRDHNLVPDLILSSTAQRARQTAQRAVEGGAMSCPVELHEQLYHAHPGELVEILRAAPNECARVMLIGHNPGLEILLHALTGDGNHLPTAALAEVELEIECWTELQINRRARLANLWRPRELA